MIRFFTIFMMIICFWFCTIPAAAQSANSSPLTLGVGIGGMNGNKQFDGNTEFQFRVFLRHYYSEYVQGEFGAGLGMISDSWYDSHLYPFDYRLLFTPEFYDEWTPYMYMGFGFVGYDVTRTDYQYLPSYLSPSYKRSGMSGYIPLGVGVTVDVDEGVGIDFNIGYNISFTDDLNGSHADSPSDAYWTFLFSVTFNSEGVTHADYVRTYMSTSDKRWNRAMNGPDSDGDGLSDYDEVNLYHTDPYNPDTDGDGLRDSYEVYTFHTDPLKPDTDGDGLSDGDEVRVYFTDPLKRDTDGDGLSDGEEVKVYHTNPLEPDTDHGGVNDGTEVAHHMNPLDPSDDKNYLALSDTSNMGNAKRTPANQPDLSLGLKLRGIQFQTASTEFTPLSVGILEAGYIILKDNPDLHVEIQGHTDNIGSARSNLDLSERRAQAVKNWLVNHGIEESRLTTRGFGYSRPIGSNATEAGRQQNRRIEFIIQR